MQRQGDEVEVTETEASAGVKFHNVRIVLMVSLLLAIIALGTVWITGVATR